MSEVDVLGWLLQARMDLVVSPIRFKWLAAYCQGEFFPGSSRNAVPSFLWVVVPEFAFPRRSIPLIHPWPTPSPHLNNRRLTTAAFFPCTRTHRQPPPPCSLLRSGHLNLLCLHTRRFSLERPPPYLITMHTQWVRRPALTPVSLSLSPLSLYWVSVPSSPALGWGPKQVTSNRRTQFVPRLRKILKVQCTPPPLKRTLPYPI